MYHVEWLDWVGYFVVAFLVAEILYFTTLIVIDLVNYSTLKVSRKELPR